MRFSVGSREALKKAAAEEEFDLVVVGGGVTGAGILRDAALRGYKAALVEKGDFASGTSSRSSKLVHGGLRYLEQYNFSLVFESTHERARLMRLAPHLVHPLPFIMPIFADSPHGMFKMNLGMWLYDLMASFKNYRNHRKIGREALLDLEHGVRADGLKGGMLYYDAMTDDARLTLETVIDGFGSGGVPLNYARAGEIGFRDGKVHSLEVHDELGGGSIEVRTRCVVCAAGPWTMEVMEAMGAGDSGPRLKPTKGTHIVLRRESLPLKHAVVMMSPVDGRVMFALPWKGTTVIGTTDTFDDAGPDAVFADRADVEYLLASVERYFPGSSVGIGDVIGTWSGLRPLLDETGLSPSEISREHVIVTDPRGIVSISGGKLTTYRIMAAETVKAAQGLLGDGVGSRARIPTENRPLPYSDGLGSTKDVLAMVETVSSSFQVERESALQLVADYGARTETVMKDAEARDKSLLERFRPDLPYLRLQAEYSATNEMAMDLVSFMTRRTPMFFLADDQCTGIAPDVADLMGGVLGWDGDRKAAEIQALRDLAGRHMAFAKPE